jgi:hypothetical protein
MVVFGSPRANAACISEKFEKGVDSFDFVFKPFDANTLLEAAISFGSGWRSR